MCGVAGLFAYHYAAPPINREELLAIRDRMINRGPDGAGAWVAADGRVGLGHRRLAVIDLSPQAAQPMTNADQSHIISFNGEIYNFRQLRHVLEHKGYVFRTESDTEVLLHLYADRGTDMVHALRGMFAFAIWDQNKQALFLARDPYGIKPLYYADDGWTFRFASQVKALLQSPNVSREPEPAGLVGFYLLGSVPDPWTTYRQIRALPAGSRLWVDATGPCEPITYFSIADVYAQTGRVPAPIGAKAIQRRVREAIYESVRHHMVADVPVGAFLSAGIDSAALIGVMSELRRDGDPPIRTVTLAFKEFRGTRADEAPLAAVVAKRYGTLHTTRTVTRAEFEQDLPNILEAMDQPSIDGINTWFVSKAARELGLKVAISGLGGDELFGGYPSFRDMPRWVHRLRLVSWIPGLGDTFRLVFQGLTQALQGMHPHLTWPHPKAAAMLKFGGTYEGAYLLKRGLFMPWELYQVLAPDLVATGLARLRPLDYIKRAITPKPSCDQSMVAALEASLYLRHQLLRDADWAGMGQALEIRLPLVDASLLRCVAQVQREGACHANKRWLAESPQLGLPLQVLQRPKSGFGMPVPHWQATSPRDNRLRFGTFSRAWAKQIVEQCDAIEA